MTDLAALAVVVLAYALVSRRLDATVVSAPMVFVAAGIVAGPDVLGLAEFGLVTGSGLVIAELALAFVLFSDAARIDVQALRARASLPARLLGLGMPLTIALGIAAGAVLLAGLELWEAAIVAVVLAPTDAALGQAVVSSPRVPDRIRNALNVEAGLNDGLSVPLLTLFVALAVEESGPAAESWAVFAAEQIGYGALVGLAVGAAGGWLVDHASVRGFMTEPFQQLAVLALAALAFILAGEAGGNGFIAAFCGGLAAGRIGQVCGERIFAFLEDEGELLSLSVFFIFGVACLELLQPADWRIAAYAALSLTVVRLLPVGVALAASGLRPVSVAFVGWFGPRGLASIVLALTVAEEAPELPALDLVLAAMALTVLASVVLHGASANPLVAQYARRLGEMPEGAAEMASVRD